MDVLCAQNEPTSYAYITNPPKNAVIAGNGKLETYQPLSNMVG
jgi:hypothetical protein